MSRLILDSEAVRVLSDPHDRRHGEVRSFLQVGRDRRRKSPGSVNYRGVVAVTVRIESGWDRTDQRWAALNGMNIDDEGVSAGHANVGAELRSLFNTDGNRRARAKGALSVADAHIGALLADGDVVATSDPGDIGKMASYRGVKLNGIVEL